jgi:NTE family protein
MSAAGRTGVVLSGGGANGAYEVGVLKALIHGASPATGYRPIDPETYTGTSVGAYNAAVMASRPGQPATAVAEELERLWLERIADTLRRCGNGVFRVRGLPFQFLDPGCLVRPLQVLTNFARDSVDLTAVGLVKGAQFAASDTSLQSRVLSLIDLQAFVSASPLHGLVEETIDLAALRRSAQRLSIAATDWERGVFRLFSKQEIADIFGTDAILASAAIPGIFAPVQVGGVFYVDGGVLLNTPLKPAIADGATIIHVIFLDPLVSNIPLKPLPSTLDTFDRMLVIQMAAAGINRMLELLKRGAPESASREEAGTFLRVAWQMYRRMLADRELRELTVHIYRPQTALGEGEGLLDFQHARLQRLIEMGYGDAVAHDCAVDGCLLPGRAWTEEDLLRRFNPRPVIA